jgi:hypothetical protein
LSLSYPDPRKKTHNVGPCTFCWGYLYFLCLCHHNIYNLLHTLPTTTINATQGCNYQNCSQSIRKQIVPSRNLLGKFIWLCQSYNNEQKRTHGVLYKGYIPKFRNYFLFYKTTNELKLQLSRLLTFLKIILYLSYFMM